MSSNTILLVEDNEDDAFFTRRALLGAGIANPVRLVEDGQEAINYLSGAGDYGDRGQNPVPILVFLDLKLPYKSGHEVLEWIRKQPEYAKLIVIVLSSSSEQSDLNRASRNGADCYVVKPAKPERFAELAKSFDVPWLLTNAAESPSFKVPPPPAGLTRIKPFTAG